MINIPNKAIIVAPTETDAFSLFVFLKTHEFRFGVVPVDPSDNCWDIHKRNTCYKIWRTKDSNIVTYSNRDFFERVCREYDRGMRYHPWVPEDPALRFISVDEFIEICMIDDAALQIEIGDLL